MRKVLERSLNLLAFLLTSRRPVTAAEIRETVAGYGTKSEAAFRRMFERDKDLLRSLGVPLETRQIPGEAEWGYVVEPSVYGVDDPGLTDDERAALWLAARVVRLGGRPSGPEAILKLGGAPLAAGVEPFAVDLGAEVDVLADLYRAVAERRAARFTYRGRPRRVEPHGIGYRRGHWYLVGVADGEPRVFRVDRMTGLTVGDAAGEFERDPAVDVRAELDAQPWETGAGEEVVATVLVDPASAWWAERRLGRPPLSRREHPDGSLELDLVVNHVDAFLGWVLAFGADAEVLAPPELRARVVARVRGEG